MLHRHACFSLYLLSISYLSISLPVSFSFPLVSPFPSSLFRPSVRVRGRVPFLGLCNCARGHLSVRVLIQGTRATRALVVVEPAWVGFVRANVRANTLLQLSRTVRSRPLGCIFRVFCFPRYIHYPTGENVANIYARRKRFMKRSVTCCVYIYIYAQLCLQKKLCYYVLKFPHDVSCDNFSCLVRILKTRM